ncbi:MAG: hypothetical protein M3Q14_00175 [bacterium]|nr:hypothetical protein [bacterium]
MSEEYPGEDAKIIPFPEQPSPEDEDAIAIQEWQDWLDGLSIEDRLDVLYELDQSANRHPSNDPE